MTQEPTLPDRPQEPAATGYPATVQPQPAKPGHTDTMMAIVTHYPAGTPLRSVCPDCLRTGERVAGPWCYWCLIERGAWIRVAWGRQP